MKRSFLTALGLEKEAIDSIMSEHGASVELLKEKHADALTAEKEKLQRKIDELQGQLDSSAKDDGGDEWKTKYESETAAHAETKAAAEKALAAEKAAHKATQDGYAAEKDAARVDSLVSAQLKAAGMHESAIPKALKLYDRTIVERDKDGGIKNSDKVLEAFKAEWGDFFGTIEKRGADVGTPPTGTHSETDPFLAGFNS